MSAQNIEMLEKAAFACFSVKVEDSYKRLLFIKVARVLKENPNITVNKCYGLMVNNLMVDRQVFDAAILALETPFQFLKVNRYTRPYRQPDSVAGQTRRASDSTRVVSHLNVIEGEPWKQWLGYVTVKYPELMVWLNE